MKYKNVRMRVQKLLTEFKGKLEREMTAVTKAGVDAPTSGILVSLYVDGVSDGQMLFAL